MNEEAHYAVLRAANTLGEINSSLSTLTWIVTIAIAIWIFNDSLFFQSEVTVHNNFCPDGLKQGVCTSNEENANRTYYKALVDQQTVVYWWQGAEGIRRYRNCAVRNSRNWSCQPGNSLQDVPDAEYKMVDGEYTEIYHLPLDSPILALNSKFYPVSRWHWWWVWLKTRKID